MNYLLRSPKLWTTVLLSAAAVGLLVYQLYVHRKNLSYLNTPLGCQQVDGVAESGFHYQEHDNTIPFRWTNGNAKLLVPINTRHPPEQLWVQITALRPTMDPVRFQLLIDGEALHDGVVPPGKWDRTFDLSGHTFNDATLVELRSAVFVPKGVMDQGKNTDPRRLGVQVQGLKLVRGAN